MKRIFTLIGLLFALNLSAQTFQVATKIEATSDCKLRFYNKIDSQIYEINSNDMVWFYISGSSIKIKDYDNEVTIFKSNIITPTFANLTSFLDSVQYSCQGGGGGIAGVEYVNGKDGDLKIIAGSNVTIDNSKSDTIVINATGGGVDSVTASNGLQIMSDGSIGLGGGSSRDINIQINGSDVFVISSDTTLDGSEPFIRMDNEILELGYNHGIDGHVIFSEKGIIFDVVDANLDTIPFVFVQDSNWTLRKVPKSDFIGDYLPLNIQDSTTVELNGNSLIVQGQNHSLALNRPYDALAIGGAIMDGFQAQQYDSIYTMNGVMKVPMFFGDTIRYPILFMSEGLPTADYYRLALFKPVFHESGFGFHMVLNNQDDIDVNHAFLNVGYVLSQDGNDNIVLFPNGDIIATGEIKGTSYVTKTSPYSYAQMQDIARIIITNPANNTLINPDIKEVIVNIESDSVDIVLPDTADCEFWHLYIKNNSTTVTTVKTENDEVAFWVGGVLSDEYTAPVGTLTHIIFDGVNYLIK